MGLALVLMQATEQLISTCLTYVLPEGGVPTLEMLLRSSQKKRTLGQFLTELRKRVDIDEHFDMILEEFLDKRNTLIHRVMEVPGWSLDTEQGCLIACQFVDRLMTVDEAVRDTFTALMVVWQKSEDIKTPVDHMFSDVDSYRKIVNHTFFEKE
jgi:hypothetical protein